MPKKSGTPRSSKRATKPPPEPEPEPVKVSKPALDVNFLSDEETDLIHDVERLMHYKPMLQDIPEEDIEAQAFLGKYGKTSSLLGKRMYDVQNFGFQTPKKANQMYERTAQVLQNSASKCASPIPARLRPTSNTGSARKSILSNTTPNKMDESDATVTTPSRGRRGSRSTNVTPMKSVSVTATPLSSRKSLNTPLRGLRLTGEEPQTPATSRRNLKRNLVRLRDAIVDNNEDDDDDESSEDESEIDSDEEGSIKAIEKLNLDTPKKAPETNGTRAQKRNLSKDNPENYFAAHDNTTGKILTSDKTLDQLSTQRLSPEALQHLLSGVKLVYQPEIDRLLQDYHCDFVKWRLQLEENFSILLYGLGSKRQLIHEFQTSMLSEENVVVVNGFFPSLAIKQILNAVTVDILETEATFTSPSEQVDFICKNLKESLFLIIHNLEGSMLRGDKNQSIIARLAAHPKIHLISSTDHINAPLMWDQAKLSFFNFVMFDVTTFLPYVSETLNENSLMVKQSGSLALNSLTRVFASLTPNAKGIYLIIVKYQMDAVKESGSEMYSGISFKDLYRMCRKGFLVNTDMTLRAQLTEFRDHKLIRSRKGADGLEYLIIPLDNATLQQFLEQQESN